MAKVNQDIQSNDSLKEIALQLKRIADALDRQHKKDILTGGLEKIKEAVKTRKDELLSDIERGRNRQ